MAGRLWLIGQLRRHWRRRCLIGNWRLFVSRHDGRRRMNWSYSREWNEPPILRLCKHSDQLATGTQLRWKPFIRWHWVQYSPIALLNLLVIFTIFLRHHVWLRMVSWLLKRHGWLRLLILVMPHDPLLLLHFFCSH